MKMKKLICRRCGSFLERKEEPIEKIEQKNLGMLTGFKELDPLTNGFYRGELIFIVSRPGIGKTSLALDFIINIALTRQIVDDCGMSVPIYAGIFTMDLSSEQIAQRILCSVAKVDINKVNSCNLSDSERQQLLLAKTKLDMENIYIDDTSVMTFEDIVSKCRRLKQERGLDIVMIDYFQLISVGKQQKFMKLLVLLRLLPKNFAYQYYSSVSFLMLLKKVKEKA